MPIGNFRWLSNEEIKDLDIMNVNATSSTGYMLEVDLSYPQSIHERHAMFPLAPEKRSVHPAEWSPWTRKVAETYRLPIKEGASKLLVTLEDKKRYVLHYMALQFYLRQGLILTKIHKVLSFTQRCWMKDFIAFNTRKRREATSEFEQDMYKTAVNSLFGKTLESKKNRIDFRLITEREKFLKLSSKPTFKSFQIINRGIVGVEMKQANVKLSHTPYTGSTILDLSKMHLYKFHYEYMLPMYGNDLTLCMTDTDSLLYKLTPSKNQCPYNDIIRYSRYFDTSNYSSEDPGFSLKNKRRMGCLKEEGRGRFSPYTYFCGLQSKVYTLEQQKQKDTKKGKGIKRSILKTFSAEDYERTLHELAPVKRHLYQAIRSIKNQMYTVEGEKRGLSAFDDKFYILSDGISTLPYGHYKIK